MNQTLKLEQIVPDVNQPRKYFGIEKMASLKASVKKHGIITPLVVQKDGDKYLLIDGERRYRTAVDLKLKEVPVNIISPKDALTRLVEQFHIQEQHESWSSTEKAMAIVDISNVSKLPLREVCELLAINDKTVRYYTAFAKLQNRERFVENQVSLNNAEKIQGIKTFARSLVEKKLGEPFTKADEGRIEKVIVSKIKDGEITRDQDYARMKDSFRSNPKLIKKFMEGTMDIDTAFVTSSAQGARFLRNMIMNANYVQGNGQGYLNNPTVAMSENEIKVIKRCAEICEKVLKLVD